MEFNKVVQLLLPITHRKPVFLAYLNVVTRPLQTLYNTFQTFMASARLQLSYNGQVIFLRQALRDRFNPGGNLIDITDGLDTQVYIGHKIEGDYQYFGIKSGGSGVMIGQLAVYDLDYEIKVEISEALDPYPSDIAVVSLVNRYKLGGKRIKVETKYINP